MSFTVDDQVNDIPVHARRFFRAEALNRWKDLAAEDIKTLNAERNELISFLQQRYGLGLKRAGSEADNFIAYVQNRVRLATEISGRKGAIKAA